MGVFALLLFDLFEGEKKQEEARALVAVLASEVAQRCVPFFIAVLASQVIQRCCYASHPIPPLFLSTGGNGAAGCFVLTESAVSMYVCMYVLMALLVRMP